MTRKQELIHLGFDPNQNGTWTKNKNFIISPAFIRDATDESWDLILKPFKNDEETK